MTGALKRTSRAILWTPLGRHSRYMLASYLRHFFMVTAALSLIALTIDLWPQIPLLTADSAQGSLGASLSIARLAALRICDLLPPFIPFATFLGVVWSEIAFTASHERMLIWNSGRSPLQCLVPALMAGLVIGGMLFVMDAYLRPAAIAVQMQQRFGREGLRLDRSISGGNHWVALPDGLVRAEIEYGPPLKLHNATIYKFEADGLLQEVDTAVLAQPSANGRWLLQDGHFWKAPAASDAPLSLGATREEPETLFRERSIPMDLNVQWLGNLGMSPQYLTIPTLRSLAQAQIVSNDAAGFRTRLQALFSEAFLPGLMAVLAASLAMLFFPYRIRPFAIIGVLMAGYLAHFSVSALLLMGEFGYVPAFVAGWLMPLVILLGIGGVLSVIQKRRNLPAILHDTPALPVNA
jgi:lipopolysaccharide export system permease protein